MSESWPLVPLGEVAHPVVRSVEVAPGIAYRTIGVKWWGEGAYERDTIDGAQTAARTLYLVRAGDLIINKIWVRHGSVAIATDAVDGCAASGEFPTFELNIERVFPRWLHWQTKSSSFWQKCSDLSHGTSGKNRIKPARFLTIKVPLPSLCEQRRIVARIEELAGKIEEARGLRQAAAEEVDKLVPRVAAEAFQSVQASRVMLGGLLREGSLNGLAQKPSDEPLGLPILRISAATSRTDGVINENDHRYLQVSGQDAAKYRVVPGDLLACRFNGNLHYVGKFGLYQGYSGKIHLYPDKLIRFRVDTAKVQPEYVLAALNSPLGREAIEGFCATTAGNIGISASDLKKVAIPVPPLDEQDCIVSYLSELQAKVASVKQSQAETAAELDALLPSVLDRAFKGEL